MRAAVASLLVLLALGPAPAPAGDAADDNYLGETLDGRTARIDDYLGRPTVVAFWASWCAPCLDEIPRLQAFQRRLGPERLGLVFVAYQDTPGRSDTLARRFADGGGDFVRARERTPAYLGAVGALPETWLFTADGAVAGIYKGAGDTVLQRLFERAEALIPPG